MNPGGEYGDNEAITVGYKDVCEQLYNSKVKTCFAR